jgi:enoyl-CoA hydratase
VPDAELDKEVTATVQRISAGAPLVNRWHKRFVYRVAGNPKPLTRDEQKEGFACFDTADFREGVRAFLAKDTPKFEGR